MICVLWNVFRKYSICGVLNMLLLLFYILPLITSCYHEQECYTLKNLMGNYYTMGEMKNLSEGRRKFCEGSCMDIKEELVCCPYQGKIEKYRILHQACLDAHLPFELVPLSQLPNQTQYPFMAALGWRVREDSGLEKIIFRCFGTMIEYRYLITTARCLAKFDTQPVIVRPGGLNLQNSTNATDYEIDQIIVHPNYEYPNIENDIAIIRIKSRFIGDIITVARTCIWYGPLNKALVTHLGYGDVRLDGCSSQSLLKTNLSIITNEECSSQHENITDAQICARHDQSLKNDCQSFSGGPIIVYDFHKELHPMAYLVGLQSFGDSCTTGKPEVYTRISKYYDWIEKMVFK